MAAMLGMVKIDLAEMQRAAGRRSDDLTRKKRGAAGV